MDERNSIIKEVCEASNIKYQAFPPDYNIVRSRGKRKERRKKKKKKKKKRKKKKKKKRRRKKKKKKEEKKKGINIFLNDSTNKHNNT